MTREVKYRVFWKDAAPGFYWSQEVTAPSRKQATAKVRERVPNMEHVVTVPERAYTKMCDTKFPGEWPPMDEVKKL